MKKLPANFPSIGKQSMGESKRGKGRIENQCDERMAIRKREDKQVVLAPRWGAARQFGNPVATLRLPPANIC